jgi:pimeloyl-ACP methyl ester carboxylesterase
VPPELVPPSLSEPPPPGSRTVRTDDGVDLHVQFDGRPDAPLTVVLTHGFTARLAEWGPQVEALQGRARFVLWDQRGHGRSGWTRLTSATIDRTAQDLGQVLDAIVPTGPVVLGGHSLGGMTIMALARRRPELFGDRVAGVFLLATSAGGLVQSGVLGRAVGLVRRLHLLRLWLLAVQALAPLLERYRRRGTLAGRWFTRRYLFGRRDATRAQVRLVQDLLEETPYPVVMAFYATFLEHDETPALPVLARVPVTVVGASDDRLTPVEHSRRMAALIGGDTELVVVPGAGHSVNLTRPEVVDQAFGRLLDRVEARLRDRGRRAG